MPPANPPIQRLEGLLLGGTLLFYIVVTAASHTPGLIWDEARYLDYARNITQGFYAEPENPDFVNGPGYPLVLAALLKLNAPLFLMRQLNALFMALAAWFSYRAVLPYGGRLWALGVALITAFHPSLVRTAPYIMTEALSVCCIAGFAWAFSTTLRAEKWRWSALLMAGLAFAWLTLTRVFFGNVLLAITLFVLVGCLLWGRQRDRLLRALAVMAIAFALCLPWLAHTYSKTGQPLCWSTNGGELLYWITSTNEGENGHWFSVEDAQEKPELAKNHREFYRPYYELPVSEREERFKQRAKENLQANPKGVLMNWLSNWSRLIFGFPRSFHAEELLTVALILINGPIVLITAAALLIGLANWRTLPLETVLLAALVFIYLGGSSLAPSLPRYSVVILPWLGLAVAAILAKHLKVRIE
jgi:4-amino-4-deoxy-L-arabinose transferase-like glycosyltransferase